MVRAAIRCDFLRLAGLGIMRDAAGLEIDERTADACRRYNTAIGQEGPVRTYRATISGADRRAIRAMAAGNIATGGSLAAEGFWDTYFRTLTNASPLRRPGGASVVTLSESPLLVDGRGTFSAPLIADTATGYDLAENSEQEAASPVLGAATFNWHCFSSGDLNVSNKMLNTNPAGVLVEEMIADFLAKRAGRKENLYAIQVILASVATGVTAASATSVTIDELLRLPNSVSDEARASGECGFLVSPTVHTTLQSLKSGDVFAWEASGLSKWPVIQNSAMPGLTAGKKPIVFGRLSNIMIAETEEVVVNVFTERKALEYQTVMNAQIYSDVALLDTAGTELACLQMAAS